jgi:hypothetical protein
MNNKGLPEVRRDYPLPPYNSPLNPNFATFANQPQFPLSTGSNANQIKQNIAALSYFNGLNQVTYDTVQSNNSSGAKLAYPTFKSQGERMLYLQGQTIAAAKRAANQTTPVSTIYNIINKN